MTRIRSRGILCITVLILLCCLPAAALGAAATEVMINNISITSAAPYLANGAVAASASAPASGGYVYFNQSAGTLTLNNAVINAAGTVPESSGSIAGIAVNGDVEIVLIGSSTITVAENTSEPLLGIYSGEATITGNGSLTLQLSNTDISSSIYGMYTRGLTVLSGTITMNISCGNTAYGLMSTGNMLFAGGKLDIEADGKTTAGLYSTMDVRITGGAVSASATAQRELSMAIMAGSLYLEGGTGVFKASGGDLSSGLGFSGVDLIYSGGVFYFSGLTAGLVYDKSLPTYNFSAPAGSVFVSENYDGSGLKAWASDAADGMLITLFPSSYSDFLYVRFSIPTQTGDASMPWLWVGLAGICMLLFAGLLVKRRQSA